MDRAPDEIGNMVGRLDSEWMMDGAGPGGDVIRHLARNLELPIRTFRQNGDYQVFQRDHPDAELHEFSVRQIGNVRAGCVRRLQRATFIVPSRERAPAKLRRVQERIGIRHHDFLELRLQWLGYRSSVANTFHVIDQLSFLKFGIANEDTENGSRGEHAYGTVIAVHDGDVLQVSFLH